MRSGRSRCRAPRTASPSPSACCTRPSTAFLNAVDLLFDLVRPSGALGCSRWRDDPRPPFGILHGAYAYLAVTRFWRTETAAATRPGRPAADASPSAGGGGTGPPGGGGSGPP